MILVSSAKHYKMQHQLISCFIPLSYLHFIMSRVQSCFDVFQLKFLWGNYCIFSCICKALFVPIALHTNETTFENVCSNPLVAELSL